MEIAAPILFDSQELVPEAWRDPLLSSIPGKFRVFNPTIAEVSGGYVMCYRVVRDGSDLRWLATCHLTPDFKVIADSVTPLSDHLRFARAEELNERARSWHADPRYARLRGRLYLSWNDGANRPNNNQFLVEMDETGLLPKGVARAVSSLPRRAIEKNWMFFESRRGIHATYSIRPHSVLSFDLDQKDRLDGIPTSFAGWASEYESWFGVLRGGAQPIPLDDGFLALAHSSFKAPHGRVYCACFYRFTSGPPFLVTEASSQPFDLPNPQGVSFEMQKLNPEVAEVVYPCGMLRRGDDLIISYGINDEFCAITVTPLAEVLASLEPVRESFKMTVGAGTIKPHDVDEGSPYSRAIPMKPTPLMWWDTAGKKFDGIIGDRKFKIGNFGDIASKDIIEHLTGGPTTPTTGKSRKLLCIGSIIHTANNQDVVWGSGMKGDKIGLSDTVKELSVHAVRGPLTLDMLRRHGIDISKVTQLFDPGVLLAHLHADEIAKMRAQTGKDLAPYRIIPHYRDDMTLRRTHYRHNKYFISVDCTPMQMIKQILSCEKVVSSSLHGIIFAESLGIPALWLAPIGGEDDLKYYDYYFGTGRFAVKRFDSLEDALNAEPMPLPRFDFAAYLDTFPTREVDVLRENGLAQGSRVQFAGIDASAHADLFSFWNFDRPGAEGLWSTANLSRFSTAVLAEPGASLMASIEVRPFNHVDFRQPQRVAISANGGPVTEITWGRGETDTVVVHLPFKAISWRTPLEVVFRAANSRTPKSMGIPSIQEPITFCLIDMQISSASAVELKFHDEDDEAAGELDLETELAMDAAASGALEDAAAFAPEASFEEETDGDDEVEVADDIAVGRAEQELLLEAAAPLREE